MPTVLLITVNDLTKGTPISDNVDIDNYVEIIKESQVFTIEPVLGTKLYKKILVDYEASTLSGIYQTIHEDYIIPILKYTVAAEYFLIANYLSRNGGVFKHQPENGTAVDKEEMDYLAKKQSAKAEVYIERLQRYLCDQEANIPEYTTNQDNDYDQKPDKDMNNYGGWFLGYTCKGMSNAQLEIYRDIFYDEGKA